MVRPPRVLVVEDSTPDFVTLCEALDEVQFRPDLSRVATVAEALALLDDRASRPDWIIIDLMLGAERGEDLCAAIARDHRLREVRVIAMSGSLDRVLGSALLQVAYTLHKPTAWHDYIRLATYVRAIMSTADQVGGSAAAGSAPG
ncbi:MAG: response regulator [Planctomycetes bacterium]|nr:response regulator [Planctomycetota bacterium]